MSFSVHSTARIFEDPIAVKSTKHGRVLSVGDVLRGPKRENSPQKHALTTQHNHVSPNPLGERHINSPPQPKKIPVKGSENSRPVMHQKTSSSASLKGFLMGKDKHNDEVSVSDSQLRTSPKKTKSSTNLVGLLKKKSKKDLQDDGAPMYTYPDGSSRLTTDKIGDSVDSGAAENPTYEAERRIGRRRTVEEEIELYTPKDYSEYRPSEQRNFRGYTSAVQDLSSPKRPFLEHKSSHSSIFTENLGDDDRTPALQRPRSRERPQPRSETAGNGVVGVIKTNGVPASPTKEEANIKRSSRILDTIASLKMKSRHEDNPTPIKHADAPLSPQDLDSAMEQMLGRYDIPQNLRNQLRNLKPEVKAGLMKGDRIGSGSSDQSHREGCQTKECERERPSKDEDGKDSKRSRSRSRTRSRILSLSKRSDSSSAKDVSTNRSASKSRPKSIDMSRPMSHKSMPSSTSLFSSDVSEVATTPGDFIHYLREVQKPELVEVGKLHKLRILLRNESVTWTDAFVKKGGFDEVVQLLYRIINIEWREEHEDNLLHETLLCLKGLSTTNLAMQRLGEVGGNLFSALLKMLFGAERKGPAEYNTRGVIISLIFAHLSGTLHGDVTQHQNRARQILLLMQDEKATEENQALDFVRQMHIARPYRMWCKEVSNVTKEVFWIFLHHMNVVPGLDTTNADESTFARRYFPSARAPHPAAPYVGGVEWEATQYLALHLDLLNGLIVSLPTLEERNQLREDLRQSGWERVMGASMRTCKEKFYGAVHDGLKTWVTAAKQDGWNAEDVRAGPPREAMSPKKSPIKKPGDRAPQLALEIGAPDLDKPTEDWL